MATAAWGWDPGSFLGLETGTCWNRGTEGPFPLGVREDTRPRGWGWDPPWTRGPGLQTSTLPLRSAATSGSPWPAFKVLPRPSVHAYFSLRTPVVKLLFFM